MKQKLLKYEFWEEEGKYYGKLFKHILKSDFGAIRKYIGQKILEAKSRPLKWLDIGIGDGAKFLDIVKHAKEKEGDLKINLVAVEPSKYPLASLRKKISSQKNVSLKIINKKFSLNLLKPNSFDVITFLHSNYYIASTPRDFENIYRRAYATLRQGGVLLVQSVAEDSDFQKLGNPQYSDWSLGRHTYKIFQSNWPHSAFKKFPTRFNTTDYLKDPLPTSLEKELLHFYRFVTQVQKVHLSLRRKEKFIFLMKRLARQHGDKYYFDFKDYVVFVRKV